ncbi:cytochrome oxidase putative small subunit CydP [Gallaecimonas xiamenensis]|uniref:Uncharacterized protein n=1 Tax=Gallaecimonas xiamenensis 3-C-1 TaxID=745411 RepID=K2JYT3_9GAMM|nr:cytochrome oxidase putative small subunit CydP [Gallaecimonas xiamenensis]EKE75489.1 hypothetical protein B3C1_07424 [Gallaecimonas xiamenensis 3-C-1]
MGMKRPALAKEIAAILVLKLALIITFKLVFFSDPVDVNQGATAIDNQFLNASPSASKESDNDR